MLSTSSDLFLRGCGLLLSFFAVSACALAQPAPRDRPATPSSVLTSYRKLPVRLCVPVKAEAWTALRGGRTRLILHLQHQATSHFYSPSFQVSLVGPAKSQRVSVDQLAMNPDIQSSAGGPPDPQHFAIDLRGQLPAAIDRSTLCVEVDIEKGKNGEIPGEGKADPPLRIWATLEPLGS
ncbi:MAG: hypothetical protein ACJ76N_14670 [Thermoanaerobaculia bacterium]